MKVYVVSIEGWYSTGDHYDYLNKVFLNLEKAQDYCKNLKKDPACEEICEEAPSWHWDGEENEQTYSSGTRVFTYGYDFDEASDPNDWDEDEAEPWASITEMEVIE